MSPLVWSRSLRARPAITIAPNHGDELPGDDPPHVCASPPSTVGAASATLFRGLDFAVDAGKIVWIRGANGQGKTTLLRTLAGLSAPAAGEIAWAEPRRSGASLYLWPTPTR